MKVFLVCYFLAFVAVGIFVGCEKRKTPADSKWVADFQELDKLCWRMDVKKNNGWTVVCTFDTGIPSIQPNKTIWIEDSDLSQALSKALSQVRSQLNVDTVVVDSD